MSTSNLNGDYASWLQTLDEIVTRVQGLDPSAIIKYWQENERIIRIQLTRMKQEFVKQKTETDQKRAQLTVLESNVREARVLLNQLTEQAKRIDDELDTITRFLKLDSDKSSSIVKPTSNVRTS